MPANKDRIYVALYARAGNPTMPCAEDTYYWALTTAPKNQPEKGLEKGLEKGGEKGRELRFHVVEEVIGQKMTQWRYEAQEMPLFLTNMLLVRVMIGKVTNLSHLMDILQNIPVVQDDPNWNCVVWVRNALEALQRDRKALGTCQLNWSKVRDAAMKYCQKKIDQHRFDGMGGSDRTKIPTFDLLEGKETTP